MSDWKEYSLGDISRNISRRFDFNAYPNVVFINTGDVLNNQFLHCDISNVKDLPGQAKKAIKKGDILYSEIRPGNGRYLFVDNDLDNYVVSTKFMVIEPNANIVLPEFLFLLLISNEITEYFKMIAESRSGTFPQITFDSVSNLSLNIPDKETQQKILDIITPLDDKIELNTQINQTLEQITQALFKSWFVDFDPVRAKVQALSDGLSLEQAELAAMQAISGKTSEELTALSQTQPERYAELAETAKAFPCEMVEVSNSIYIPKGWKIKYFNEIIDTYIDNRGKTPPIEKQGIPLLEVKHLPKNSVFPDLNTTKYISNDTYENWLRNKPEALDIMLSTVGTVGRVNLVPTNNKIAIAQNILGFRFNLEKATQIYMFYLMKSEKFIFDMEARVVETVQKSIKRKDLEKIPLLIPTLELQNLFSKFVIPFVIKQNNSENTNLEKIRNDLLPKLLSGEIQL